MIDLFLRKGADYRLRAKGPREYVLQIMEPGDPGWQDLLGFSDEPQLPIDFKYSNWAISTMPDSRFVMHRIAARLIAGDPERGIDPVRHTFFDGTYRRRTPAGLVDERELDPKTQEQVLREVFALDLPTPLRWR